MKYLIAVMLLLVAIPLHAADIKMSWSYSDEDQELITNFLIYRDNITDEAIILKPAPDVRSVIWDEQDMENDHVYFIAAENADDNLRSNASAFAWYRAPKQTTPITPNTFIIEIPPITVKVQ